MFSSISAGLFRRAELMPISASCAGSSCATRIAEASRACGQSAAPTAALATMHATAKLSRVRFMPKPLGFAALEIVCRIYDTTAPTKEGLLWNDKIVSNLHEQMSGRGLWESSIPASMVRSISTCCVLLIASPPPLLSKVNIMADHVVPHFHNDAGVPIIEIASHEFMWGGANPPFDH